MPAQSTPHALVVDDDPIILMDARAILEDAGFQAHEASSGDEAIGALEQHARDVTLVFSDVEMPGGLNGFALARHIAEHWPWIEIVIASGRLRPGDGDMPHKASFIAKPFNADTVRGHLRTKLPEDKKPGALKA